MKPFHRLLLLLIFQHGIPADSQIEQLGQQNPPEQTVIELRTVEIIGESEEELNQVLAPKRVKPTENQTDPHRAVKNTPGVYTRDEDGAGLRPNIGLRGTSPDRSKKIVLMEDGVLIGPAPFAAPAAYYSPNMNHVESIQIYKGFAATPFGPNSVGGSLDFISSRIPSESKYLIQSQYGSFETYNSKISLGSPTFFGGYLFEVSQMKSDGFKDIDGGNDAGFRKNNYLGKIKLNLPALGSVHHEIEITGQKANENSNETYLGLSRSDFDANPYRRYSASEKDSMQWKHSKLQVKHIIQPTENFLITTQLYQHHFERAWYRLDGFRDPSMNIRNLLNRPSTSSVFYDILRGREDSSAIGTNGQLVIANNDRRYISEGIQTKLTWMREFAEIKISPELFYRLHSDAIQRKHSSENYEMLNGRMKRTTDPRQTILVNEDSARARSLAFTLPVEWESWTVLPVIRTENVDFVSEDQLDPSRNRKRSDSAFIHGIGIVKKMGEHFSVRLSRNNAATLAGLSTTGQEVKEEAINHEAEFKYANSENLISSSLVLFQSDYQNLTGTCTTSAGCSSAQQDAVFNGGKAIIKGAELSAAKIWQWGAVDLPISLSSSLLDAKFNSDFTSTSPEWGVGEVKKGDPLPYIPALQYGLSLGLNYKKIKQELMITYQSKVYDQSAEAGREEVEAYGILDWSGQYAISEKFRILGKVDNLLAREYAAAARPFGWRPGKPQSFHIGLAYQF